MRDEPGGGQPTPRTDSVVVRPAGRAPADVVRARPHSRFAADAPSDLRRPMAGLSSDFPSRHRMAIGAEARVHRPWG